jgi:hypothetical protein
MTYRPDVHLATFVGVKTLRDARPLWRQIVNPLGWIRGRGGFARSECRAAM